MCVLISVGLAMYLNNDKPISIAFEDCNNKIVVSDMSNNNKLDIIKYDENTGIYYVKDKR